MFRRLSCVGHVSYQNLKCDYYIENNVCDEINWEGVIENP